MFSFKVGDRVIWQRVDFHGQPGTVETGTIVHESSRGGFYAVTADSDNVTICGLTADQFIPVRVSEADRAAYLAERGLTEEDLILRPF